MVRINVNLDEIESGFQTIPDGDYYVEITSEKVAVADGGGQYIKWIAKVLEGDYEGVLVSWNTSTQPQALWNLKDMLEKCGMEWDEDGFDSEDVVGAKLIVTNVQQEYQGEQRNNIVGYLAAG